MLPKYLSRRLVLASQSPRRIELLRLTGLSCIQKDPQIDESKQTGESPKSYAQRLAREKATAVMKRQNDDSIVLAADTIVVHNDAILGKPSSAVHAEQMLSRLQGKTHKVVTAIALARTKSGEMTEESCSTYVRVRQFSHQGRRDYIASGDPLDKSGSYGIQNPQFRPATTLGGCLANVIGLPLCHVSLALSDLGMPPSTDVPQACQVHTGYDCPVYQDILAR